MRTITSLTTIFALALGLTACGDDKNETVTTGDPTTNTTPPATSGESETAAESTGPGTSEPTTDPATSEPTTAPTTDDPATTDPGTTTNEPDTTTGPDPSSTTEPDTTTAGGDESPYQACTDDAECNGGICINSMKTGGQVKGSFCSPACSGPGKLCPDAAAGVKAQAPQCIFGADAMNPTNCAVICAVGMDDCGPESDCEDIGIEPQMGVTPGICTTPA